MPAETERMHKAGLRTRKADDGDFVGQHSFDARPSMHELRTGQHRKQVERGARGESEALDIERHFPSVQIADTFVTATDHDMSARRLLERHRATGKSDDRCDEGW